MLCSSRHHLLLLLCVLYFTLLHIFSLFLSPLSPQYFYNNYLPQLLFVFRHLQHRIYFLPFSFFFLITITVLSCSLFPALPCSSSLSLLLFLLSVLYFFVICFIVLEKILSAVSLQYCQFNRNIV
jgi:hypothetical protein